MVLADWSVEIGIWVHGVYASRILVLYPGLVSSMNVSPVMNWCLEMGGMSRVDWLCGCYGCVYVLWMWMWPIVMASSIDTKPKNTLLCSMKLDCRSWSKVDMSCNKSVAQPWPFVETCNSSSTDTNGLQIEPTCPQTINESGFVLGFDCTSILSLEKVYPSLGPVFW